MLLRERQKVFVESAIRDLTTYKSTLGIAPTGAGKTILLSFIVKHYIEKNKNFKVCVLAHRDELTSQNEQKFKLVCPSTDTSILNATSKDWDGQVTFAMVQTLSRKSNIESMPKIDLLVIDEAHHATSTTYKSIIDRLKELNSNLLILGVTATPARADKALLKNVFKSICDTIRLVELIDSGHLVEPKTNVIDLGITDELLRLKNRDDEYDMSKVDLLMNSSPINQKIIDTWKEKAGDRKTVVFCSTINHAQNITDAFYNNGISAALITGELNQKQRNDIFKDLDEGKIQVIVNVSVLTEGWDYQPISCVVLLRPCSYKGTMIQMIGRGLRTVDYSLYPNIVKKDCIVLDYGASIITHGSLEIDINFQRESKPLGKETAKKTCPECYASIPVNVMECDLCGFIFESEKEKKEKEELSSFKLKEVNLLERSNFNWIDLKKDPAKVVSGYYVSVILIKKNDLYLSVGIEEKTKIAKIIFQGNEKQCIAFSEDYLNQYETDDSCYNNKRWHKMIATDKQKEYLPKKYINTRHLDRYTASCILKYKFNINNLKSIGAL